MFVAYANGANDNFKGVATLFGSGTTTYRKALWLATGATLTGSVAAAFVATTLDPDVWGRGLIPAALAGSKPFPVAVILGAAFTVFLATKIGAPISTTHSLTGAMIGTGLVAVGFDLDFSTLWTNFLETAHGEPITGRGFGVAWLPLFRLAANWTGFTKETCLCIGEERVPVAVAMTPEGRLVTTGTVPSCRRG
ncbi:MAG: inorganic phosphate transporter [Candidatus Methylomirabilis sp.]|nr:inorganic phosphate transporter [Candidatus Methylomirabilis sp.]